MVAPERRGVASTAGRAASAASVTWVPTAVRLGERRGPHRRSGRPGGPRRVSSVSWQRLARSVLQARTEVWPALRCSAAQVAAATAPAQRAPWGLLRH
ncbi:hypothetical protein [Mycolicibacterium canariasense]|uniref:hypothetical protein n=1 Tax=Mycolicibacterium canariasense TaxID=228230 RepID=UPI0032D57CC4